MTQKGGQLTHPKHTLARRPGTLTWFDFEPTCPPGEEREAIRQNDKLAIGVGDL
jgi:hypothetical protein